MSGCACGCGGNSGACLVNSLQSAVACALSVRDSIGAILYKVYLLRRTWSGKRPGDGEAVDHVERLLPTPLLVEYGHDVRLLEGGVVKMGDILLKGISRDAYPLESQIDGSSDSTSIENFYLIDDKIYNVIQVKHRYVTWDVQLRKLADQTRY